MARKKLNFSREASVEDFYFTTEEGITWEVIKDSVEVSKENESLITFLAINSDDKKVYRFYIELVEPLSVEVADQVFILEWAQYDYEEEK